ncbi:MAG: TlpA disulfide reductase family protein, partial [Bacteroidaceae bacterium]|nr:TlpA disulfide reductase family protein [Bacteroidaceae bacterium]
MKRIAILFMLLLPLSMLAQTQEKLPEGVTPDSTGYIIRVGQTVPDIKWTQTDGKTVSIKDLRGKVVMLQFTASWCGVCRREMPFIERDIWQKHKD